MSRPEAEIPPHRIEVQVTEGETPGEGRTENPRSPGLVNPFAEKGLGRGVPGVNWHPNEIGARGKTTRKSNIE